MLSSMNIGGGRLSLINDIQRLARNQCATFNAATDSDCLRDCQCIYFRAEGGRCSYFENCVLAGNEALHARYWNALGNTDVSADYCVNCREPYERKSNQRYCTDCGKKIAHEKKKKRDREYRARKRAENRRFAP